MSLLSDPNFLIHRLRLSYLRNVEDPYGPRLISLSSSYNSNPYILAASLADISRWPELAMPSSPQLSEDENENDQPSGFPGAVGLKYTQTIMGSKSGGMGLRVSGRRSTLERTPGTPRQEDVKMFLSDNALTQDTTMPDSPSDRGSTQDQGTSTVSDITAKAVQFIPRFKGAAEMEARRRMRMLARQGPGGTALPLRPPPPSNLELSSPSSSEVSMDEDDEFDEIEGADDMEDDEFDPDFAATRMPGADSASDVPSVLSGVVSTPNSSALASSLPTHNNARARLKLSPVVEGRHSGDNHDRSIARRPIDKSADSYSDTVTPVPKTEHTVHPPRKSDGRPKAPAQPLATTTSLSEMSFPRRHVAPIRQFKSALTTMMASSGVSSNPFAETYAAISGRAEAASTNVQVYFPHARQPAGKAMDLKVRKDATVEEVIGFALWSYWEASWEPKLDDGIEDEDDPNRSTKLSAVGWIMRIAEEDGEVDDEFPSPDRTGKIAKFNFDAYAILEASPAQVQQNRTLESKIQRRPSRTASSKKAERPLPTGLLAPPTAPGTSGVLGTMVESVPLPTSLGPSSSHGPLIFLRIRVADTADAVHISTTIPVSAGMYMQEVLELVCRKRKLPNPKDYTLLLGDMSLLIPLDRTVASLQGKRELVLVKQSMLPQLGIDVGRVTQKTTDPNASIFKPMSELPEIQSSALDYTTAYKKYVIYRKMPMLVTRQERTLAIDGVYIHIMPSTNKAKAVFDNGKTSSYHIRSIAGCQQSTKSSSIFKLIVNRDSGNKRYDFEAESPKLANEIVQTIRSLKTAVERSSTGNKARRSRQVV